MIPREIVKSQDRLRLLKKCAPNLVVRSCFLTRTARIPRRMFKLEVPEVGQGSSRYSVPRAILAYAPRLQ